MLWEIRGTRNNQPIRAKVSASSEESARKKAEANGVVVQVVLAIDSPGAPAATPEVAAPPEADEAPAEADAEPSLDAAEMAAPAAAYQRAAPAQPQWPTNAAYQASAVQQQPYLPPGQMAPLQYGTPGMESGQGISGLSIASLVCGAMGTCLFCLWPIALVTGLTGLTLGIVAWVTASKKQNRRDRNFAIAGTCVSTLPFIILLTLAIGLVALITSVGKQAAKAQAANAAQQSAIASQNSASSQSAQARMGPSPAELQARLAEIPTFWKPANSPPVDLMATMKGRFAGREGEDGTLVKHGGNLMSADSFRPPVSFRIIARSDEKEFRLGYGVKLVNFNQPANHPVAGTNSAGALPYGQWVAIELAVNPDAMVIYIDGTERYRAEGNFSKSSERLRMFASGGDVRIYSVTQTTP
jgi:hypothetical protein